MLFSKVGGLPSPYFQQPAPLPLRLLIHLINGGRATTVLMRLIGTMSAETISDHHLEDEIPMRLITYLLNLLLTPVDHDDPGDHSKRPL